MQLSTQLLDDAADAVRAFRGAHIGSLTHGQLLEAQSAAARARRAADLLVATLAGEIAERSVAGGLAKAEGFSSPERLVASLTGGSLADAGRLIEAGSALAEDGPLGRALAAGSVSVEAASLIRSTLARMQDPDGTHENRLVAMASEQSLQDLRRACTRYEALIDAVAWQDREQRQYGARCVTIGTDHAGMVVITARLDPPSAAPVIAWLDAQVRDAFQRQREATPGSDFRTVGQIRADALVALATHGLRCEQPTSGVSTTVVVRIGLEQLRTGLGLGECDQVDAPISAAAARAMAVDAEIIPLVMGAASEPLDLGRSRRLFTRSQRLALVERDGGCAWCHAPPSYCDAHHIQWWDKHHGPTNLDNAVLLCRSCHRRLHDTGWEVQATPERVYFVPPATVDPQRVPRLGGRAQLTISTDEPATVAAEAAA